MKKFVVSALVSVILAATALPQTSFARPGGGGGFHGGGGSHWGGGGYHGDGGSRWGGGGYHGGGGSHWGGGGHRYYGHDFNTWRGGYWNHGWHGDQLGWWWVVNNLWYGYPAAVYPYPDPYIPPVVSYPAAFYPYNNSPMVVQSAPPVVQAQVPASMWYYCDRPSGYYPYVSDCPSGWRSVPATPPR